MMASIYRWSKLTSNLSNSVQPKVFISFVNVSAMYGLSNIFSDLKSWWNWKDFNPVFSSFGAVWYVFLKQLSSWSWNLANFRFLQTASISKPISLLVVSLFKRLGFSIARKTSAIPFGSTSSIKNKSIWPWIFFACWGQQLFLKLEITLS